MKKIFARNMAISAAVHALVVVLLLVFSFFSFRARRRPREITTFVDLQIVAPEPATVEEPAKTADPAPAPPELKPATPRKEIEVSRRLVTREAEQQPPLTAEDIRRSLRDIEPLERPATSPDDYTRYLAQVQAVMYESWQQPKIPSGAQGLTARALIRVRSDGRIVHRALIRPSGNETMDSSIMKALKNVQQLPPLPAGRGTQEDIPINFELTAH